MSFHKCLGKLELHCIAILAFLMMSLQIPSYAFYRVELEPTPKRLALVIGNDAYKDRALQNSVKDARLVSQTLRRPELGFSVTELHNQNRIQMRNAMREFSKKVKPGDVAVFYFTGHGALLYGENYLIPIDFDISDPEKIPYRAIESNLLMNLLRHNGGGRNISFLDAGLSNPYGIHYGSMPSSPRIGDLQNNFVSFSSSPRQVSSEISGFAEALAKYMLQPDLNLEDMMRLVRQEVVKRTQGRQVPYYVTNFSQEFCFAGCKVEPSNVHQADVDAEERWALVMGNQNYVSANDRLKYPIRDANLMVNAFKSIGIKIFENKAHLDLSGGEMQSLMKRFSEFAKRKSADSTLVYYAGHAAQVDGNNYLIPVDIDIFDSDEITLSYKSTNLNMLLDYVKASGSGKAAIFLDACRNNPYRGGKGRGVIRVEAPEQNELLISYATAAGELAADNSHYTPVLARLIQEHANLPIDRVVRKVRGEVERLSKSKQFPSYTSSLSDKPFCLAQCENP